VPEGQPASYAGYPAFVDEAQAQRLVNMACAHHWQVLVHTNGDAAVDQLIRTVSKAKRSHPGKDRRTTLVHGQYLRQGQVPELKKLEIFPSLYPMHTFYWGDWHRDSVAGPERAENISPTGWLLDNGLAFSIHSDAPVTFPNSMCILDRAVNRTTGSGRVLGPKQKLSVYTALQAMTIWPARQHFEERNKGSLEKGKLADLIVLDANPLDPPADKLMDIHVVETIKAGTTVYQATKL
jgi:predicted amidohydrolase YtcJ